MNDVIVIGGGAAGLSAALWCDELGLETLLLEARAEIGGQLLRVYNPVANHLGVETNSGRDLRDCFAAQIAKRAFELRLSAAVVSINLRDKRIELANNRILTAQHVILATGVRRRRLNVPGETEFVGRGILESGKRDQALVAGKTVCIVGGGDAAAENALILAETAARVYLVHRRSALSARPEFVNKILAHPRVEILTETAVVKIIGDETVEAVELRRADSAETMRIEVEAILLRIGVEPNTELFKPELTLDANGYAIVNQYCETNIPNVFAVGDMANPLAPTVSTAVGMGAIAAKVIVAKRGAK